MTQMTIEHVAQSAGVSKATVSRVINRSTRVAPDVSQRVQKAIDKLGYKPPARRSGPKSAKRPGIRNGNVLLLVLGFGEDDPYGLRGYPDLMRGVETALNENGLKTVIASLSGDGPLPVALDRNEIDGVLLFGRSEVLSASAKAKLRRLPAVCLMRGFDEFHGELDRVIFNNAAVGPMAAEHLAKQGHKHVAFYSIGPDHRAMKARHANFLSAAAEAGMEVTSLISERQPIGLQQETLEHNAHAERLASASPRPTGVFVPMGYWAPYAYQALTQHGMIPGKDIEVVACDNVPLFIDQLDPRPATIDINLPLVGELGVRQLLWRIANPQMKNVVETLVEPVLVPGKATELGTP